MCNVSIKQFLIILISLTILVESLVNDARFAHTSAIINNRLYIIGGQTQTRQMGSNDVFYLDLAKSFDLKNPPWVDITKTSRALASSWANAAVLGDDVILLFEGYTWDINSRTQERGENSLYLFNISSQLWTVPTVSGTSPVRRREMKIVSDDVNKKIYIYGGAQLPGENDTWLMDMHILDTFESKFNWALAQMDNPPPFPRVDYTATLLPNGVIAYIGGRIRFMEYGIIKQTEANITQVGLYNTKEARWYLMVTGGNVIDNRSGHSAVLTSDGRIIIYGGVKGNPTITASPDVAVLDTKPKIYQWSAPQTSSLRPPPLTLHTANMYLDYMILAFGNITNGATSPLEINSGIYMLDTKAYSWITSYNSTIIPPDDNHDSLGLILGLASAGLAVTVIFIIIGVLLYKRWRSREEAKDAIPTPSAIEMTGGDGGNARDNTANRSSTTTTTSSSNYDRYSVTDDSSLIRPISSTSNVSTSRPNIPPSNSNVSTSRPSNIPASNSNISTSRPSNIPPSNSNVSTSRPSNIPASNSNASTSRPNINVSTGRPNINVSTRPNISVSTSRPSSVPVAYSPKTSPYAQHVSYTGIGGISPTNPPYGSR